MLGPVFVYTYVAVFIYFTVDVVSHADGCTVCHRLNTCGKDIVLFAGILLSKYYFYDVYNECFRVCKCNFWNLWPYSINCLTHYCYLCDE